MNAPILVSRENDSVTLTLNKPEQLNALDTELVEGLHTALDSLQDSAPKLVVFSARGKGFSGGLDLSGLDNESDGDLLLRLVRIEQLLQRVRHARYATAAMVHGACYGAAADLVLACRTRVAATDGKFLMPGMRFGIVLGTRRLRDTLGENNAYQLLDRVSPFKAQEALATGFITQLADADEWPGIETQLLHELAGFSKSAYAKRVSSLTPDTRAHDMEALVTSIADGSIKARMIEYVAQVSAKKRGRT